HDTARQYLSLLVGGQTDIQKTLEVYREYAKLADRPGLPQHLYARLAAAFLDAGHISDGRKILAELIRRRPNPETVPALLLRLANALEREGMPARAEKYRQILRRRYPHSQEARLAEQRRR
ncbi:MAG TPA: hypothetical protein VKO20_01330, partial [Desulfosalsimonadaceae bacterium]|nr:hypothetical protein [Desulfosalsimonadaceae bacterium]